MATIRWGLGTGADLCLPFVGNSTLDNARYIGAGSPNDDVALDWNVHEVDEHTKGLWRFDGDWTDASGHGLTMTHTGNAALLTGQWMDGAAILPDVNSYAECAAPDVYETLTVEFWMWPEVWDTTNYRVCVESSFRFSVAFRKQYELNLHYYTTTHLHRKWFRPPIGGWPQGWSHIAMCSYGGYRDQRTWVNGTEVTDLVYQATGGNSELPASTMRLGWVDGVSHQARYDDLRISNIARYTENFTPTRYPMSGTVVAVTPQTFSRTINAIAWDATVGAAIGSIYRIHVNTGTDAAPNWTQVGGDNPTSPITGIGLATSAANLVRVTLTPGFDPTLSATPQNQTPVLDWLEVDWTAVGGVHNLRPPLHRLGPSIKGVR